MKSRSGSRSLLPRSDVMREIREERHHLQEVMMATQSRQAEVAGENFTVARTLDWLVNCFQKLWKTGWKLDFISFFSPHRNNALPLL